MAARGPGARLPDFDTARLRVASWDALLSEPDRLAGLTRDLGEILTEEVLAPLPAALALHGPGDVPRWIAARARAAHVHTVTLRGEMRLVGLFFDTDGAEARHIGYLFGKAYWAQGFASELVQGAVAAAQKIRGIDRLVAGVDLKNPASARVLEKAGFTQFRAGPDHILFEHPFPDPPVF